MQRKLELISYYTQQYLVLLEINVLVLHFVRRKMLGVALHS